MVRGKRHKRKGKFHSRVPSSADVLCRATKRCPKVKNMMRLLAFLLLCSLPTSLLADDRTFTEGGTWWKGLAISEKLFFVMGYAHGYSVGANDFRMLMIQKQIIPFDKIVSLDPVDYSPDGITFGTLVEGIDRCYSDSRNSSLDVEDCADWTVRGLKGDSDGERESMLADYRRTTGTGK
jgi:hypothetical protein